jgi:ABC-type amino acid transport substrate-binding protein
MVPREVETMQLMNIKIMLTPDQVANEILQAVTEGRRDLTLAPNPDIALMLQLMKDDPDKAEMLAGESFRQRLAQLSGQPTQ